MTVTSASAGPEVKYLKQLRPPPKVADVRSTLLGLDRPESRNLVCEVHGILHRHDAAHRGAKRPHAKLLRKEMKSLLRDMGNPVRRKLPLVAHRISREALDRLLVDRVGMESARTTARRIYRKLQFPPPGPQERQAHDALLIFLLVQSLTRHGIAVDGKFDRDTAEPTTASLTVVYELVKLLITHLSWRAFRHRWYLLSKQ